MVIELVQDIEVSPGSCLVLVICYCSSELSVALIGSKASDRLFLFSSTFALLIQCEKFSVYNACFSFSIVGKLIFLHQ